MARAAVADTAIGPMVILAAEQHLPASERVVDDRLARSFLTPSMRIADALMGWPPAQRWMIRLSDADAVGLWGNLLCRKAYARAEARRAIVDGIGQVVVFGAGIDTLACLVPSPAGVPSWEVDLPENIELKRKTVTRALGAVPAHVRLVPTNFEGDGLADSLAQAGLRLDQPALFVMEAVSQYLTEEAMNSLLGYLAGAAAGSRFCFTYVQKDFFDGTRDFSAASLRQRFVIKQPLWSYALDPSQVEPLLARYGWAVREDLGVDDYHRRFVVPTGRNLTVSDVEHFVGADKSAATR